MTSITPSPSVIPVVDEAALEHATRRIYEDKGDRKGVDYVGWDKEPERVKAQWREDVRFSIQEYLTAALSCPDGFRLVPAHLTDEMVEAAFESGYEGTEDHLRKDYRAMLAASPAPPQDAPPPWSLSNKD